jgi:heme-degrading monooxygenase HmoA
MDRLRLLPSLAGGLMPVIVVTRLRLSDPALFDEFFASAVAVTEQAKNSDGNLGADVLADANNVFWTLTAWQARRSMQAFVGSEPHLTTMARIDDWCDEATFADWEQTSPGLPDWQTGYDHLIADGQVASLTHASDAHQTRAFPAPATAP